MSSAAGCDNLNDQSFVAEHSVSKEEISRFPVAQSAAKRAVNPGVVSSNPGSANILSDV